MERYYVSKSPSPEGFREIHKQGCGLIPQEGERIFLGMCRTSNEDVAIAQNLFSRVCPCSCCLENAVANTEADNRPVSSAETPRK